MRVFHFTSTKYALRNVQKQWLKVARIKELNDPFELLCADLHNKSERKKFKAFKKEVSQDYGVLCFSSSWKNPLMWSHYANGHKGVALEFEIQDNLLTPIDYVPERVKFDISHIAARGGFQERDIDKLLSTKSEHWSYEQELRMEVKLKDCESRDGLFFEPFSEKIQLVRVILGHVCKLKDSDVEAALPKGTGVKILQARAAFTTFDIREQQQSPERTVVRK